MNLSNFVPGRLDEIADIYGHVVSREVLRIVGEAHIYDNADTEQCAEWIAQALQIPASVRLSPEARNGETWDIADPDDEIIGRGYVHIERMSNAHVWIGLGDGNPGVHVNLHAVIPKGRKRPVLRMLVGKYGGTS